MIHLAGAFQQAAEPLRSVLCNVAIRIDHIGSTSIPNLAAKPIIDIQVSAKTMASRDSFRLPLESLGYTAKGKRIFNEKIFS